ncbi:hypothetical protein HNP01_16450 [Pseudomonas corrugata]|nr:hypothetical protein [Pseudomonas corrugata]
MFSDMPKGFTVSAQPIDDRETAWSLLRAHIKHWRGATSVKLRNPVNLELHVSVYK